MSREDWRRRFRIARRTVGGVALPIAAPTLLRILARSWHVERVGHANFEEAYACEGMLVTMWHGRMIFPVHAHAHQGFRVLVSPSDDGGLVTALLEHFGYGVVRGSTNKNPTRAVRQLLDQLDGGGRIVITPDGPRGPRHSMNRGPAWIARETGYPILPLGFACDRAWYMRSWDRFTIPKLRARVAMVYADPIRVSPEADDAEVTDATDELRRRMLAAETEAFERVRAEPDW